MRFIYLWLILLMQTMLFEYGEGFRINKRFRQRNGIFTTPEITKNQDETQKKCSDDMGVLAYELAPTRLKQPDPDRIKSQTSRKMSRKSWKGLAAVLGRKRLLDEPSGGHECDEIHSKFESTLPPAGPTSTEGLLNVRKTHDGQLKYVAFEATREDVQDKKPIKTKHEDANVEQTTKKPKTKRSRGSKIHKDVTVHLQPGMLVTDERGHIRPASLLKRYDNLNKNPDNFFPQDASTNGAWGSQERQIANFLEEVPHAKVKMEYYFEYLPQNKIRGNYDKYRPHIINIKVTFECRDPESAQTKTAVGYISMTNGDYTEGKNPCLAVKKGGDSSDSEIITKGTKKVKVCD